MRIVFKHVNRLLGHIVWSWIFKYWCRLVERSFHPSWLTIHIGGRSCSVKMVEARCCLLIWCDQTKDRQVVCCAAAADIALFDGTKKDSSDGDDDANGFIDMEKEETLIISMGRLVLRSVTWRHLSNGMWLEAFMFSPVVINSFVIFVTKERDHRTINARVKLLIISGTGHETDL